MSLKRPAAGGESCKQDSFSGTEELTEQIQAEPIWTEQVQLGPVQIRQPLTETPVLERKMITDASGIVEAVGLPVSYLAADGTRKPYRYELREITAPDGYVCSDQVYQWYFSGKAGMNSYQNGEMALVELTVQNKEDEPPRTVSRQDADPCIRS